MTDFREEFTESDEEYLRRLEWGVTQKKFRHKQTGEVVTQVPILELSDYEEVVE